MPLQNRVTPFGRLIRSEARGAWMGNRGILHDEQREIVRQMAGRAWIICALQHKGGRRRVMTPGKYTELFFLDEATALAAGHRPCFECRRASARDFRRLAGGWETVNALDRQLHDERLQWVANRRRKQKRSFEATLGELPDYSFVADGESAYLWLGGRLLGWTPFGYEGAQRGSPDRVMMVLTPPTTLTALRAGYRPQVDGSAD